MDENNRFERWLIIAKENKLRTIFIILFFCFFIEICLSFLIVTIRWSNDEDYISTIDKLHVTRFFIYPFFDTPDKSLKSSINYLGNYQRSQAKRNYYPGDSLLGWRIGQSVAITKSTISTKQYGLHVTNKQGFSSSGKLDFHYVTPKPQNIFRVIILGGSTVDGSSDRSYQDNLSAKLQKHLDEICMNKNRKIEVVNAGVGGYNSGQELLYLFTLMQHKPDLIIVYDGWNDQQFAPHVIQQIENFNSPFKTPTHNNNEKRINNSFTFLGASKHFFYSLINALHDFYSGLSISVFTNKFLYDSPDLSTNMDMASDIDYPKLYKEYIQKYYEVNIKMMIHLTQMNEVAFAHFLQPIMGIDSKNHFGAEIDIYEESNRLSKKFIRRRQFYKLARTMSQNLSNEYNHHSKICIADLSLSLKDVEERVYEDTGHLLQNGNSIVAKKMIEKLLQHGMLDQLNCKSH